jgi:hypothetical protein
LVLIRKEKERERQKNRVYTSARFL